MASGIMRGGRWRSGVIGTHKTASVTGGGWWVRFGWVAWGGVKRLKDGVCMSFDTDWLSCVCLLICINAGDGSGVRLEKKPDNETEDKKTPAAPAIEVNRSIKK